jgi:outer membrane lipoprotein-sorting protein
MKSTLSIALIFFLNTFAMASDLSAEKIIEKIQATYHELDNFSCDGSIKTTRYVNNYPLNTWVTEFTIKLKKPNLYLITWIKKDTERKEVMTEGAVWNDGTQPYLYQKDFGAYFSFSSDEIALSSATGISGRVAVSIPSLFFKSLFNKNNWLTSFKNLEAIDSKKKNIILRGININSESIDKFELQIVPESNLLIKTFSSSTSEENPEKRIEHLKALKEKLQKYSGVFENMYKDPNSPDTSNDNDTILDSIDERIARESQLPQTSKAVRYEIEEIFSNLNTQEIQKEEFQFHVPKGVEFKGNELEQPFEKTK